MLSTVCREPIARAHICVAVRPRVQPRVRGPSSSVALDRARATCVWKRYYCARASVGVCAARSIYAQHLYAISPERNAQPYIDIRGHTHMRRRRHSKRATMLRDSTIVRVRACMENRSVVYFRVPRFDCARMCLRLLGTTAESTVRSALTTNAHTHTQST